MLFKTRQRIYQIFLPMKNKSIVFIIIFLFISHLSSAVKVKKRFYFSWGYNHEWYAKNNINISQPSLQNNYSFLNVKGIDKPGWNEGIFKQDLTIPQYNYRLGYNINTKWSGELNFDHTKYQVSEQILHVSGVYQGRAIDSTFNRTNSNLTYQLNNGANFFLFNAVRKFDVLHTTSSKINIKFLAKGGIGFMYPHVENTIMGQNNKPHFQFGGFDAGLEACVQVNLFRIFYIEYSNKVIYAMYRNLRIYDGTASQNLACYQMILSLGVRF